MAYATTNPYTGEVVKTFPDATDAEIIKAIEDADKAFSSWKETSFASRAKIMQKAADLLRKDLAGYAKLLTLEMGKIISEAKAEVELSAAILEYYANNAETLLASETLPVADPAEGEAIIEKLMLDAGLPKAVFQNLYAAHAQTETIISHPLVRGVALTGSEGAGAIVASTAGKALKKSTLELGGADAFVVLADAEMEKTVNWAVFGRHWNGGQVCVSSKRMIIADEVYDDFVEQYTAGVAKLQAGDPFDPATTLAPLSSQSAADELKVKISEAIKLGATATEVGPKVPSQGAFVQPTILTNISEDNPARNWEFFGPVSMLFRAKDEADAIRIANDSPFGLGGSVFTSDPKHGLEVAKQISTGMIFINHPTMVKADLPFGGIRHSGYGRELIGLGIKEFVNHKLIDVVDIDAPF